MDNLAAFLDTGSLLIGAVALYLGIWGGAYWFTR